MTGETPARHRSRHRSGHRSEHRSGHGRHSDAERILSGRAPADGLLSEVLRAATAPPLPDELAREGIALRAFRTRSPYVVAEPPVATVTQATHQRGRLRLAVSVRLSAVAATIAVALAGVAVAESNVLPGAGTPTAGPGRTASDIATSRANAFGGAPTASSSRVAGPNPVASAIPSGSATPSSPSTSQATSPANLRGQCKAYLNDVAKGRTPPPTSNAYRRLVTAAGGADNVAAYCDALLSSTRTSPGPSTSQAPHGTAGSLAVNSPGSASKGKGKGHAKSSHHTPNPRSVH